MENLTFQNSIGELLRLIPEIRDFKDFQAIASHGNADNQYVVFGVFENFYIESFQQNKKDLIKRMSKFLEEAAKSKDIKLQELAAYGFLENLSVKADYYGGIVKTFGEYTKKQLSELNV
ncbi:MAG: hypothetical protein EXS55_00010 [Candidatus Magasanikbacteria bacterium]|nr:hypothetical protein [Candidatus Magasanikbacteria bacterium]